MAKTTTITIRIDAELKKESTDALHKLGLTKSKAITLFLKQVSRTNEMPFDISPPDDKVPNAETLAAKDDLVQRRNKKVFSSVDEALKDMGV